jgi:hypothetical protein
VPAPPKNRIPEKMNKKINRAAILVFEISCVISSFCIFQFTILKKRCQYIQREHSNFDEKTASFAPTWTT